jgi:hypothetical protein
VRLVCFRQKMAGQAGVPIRVVTRHPADLGHLGNLRTAAAAARSVHQMTRSSRSHHRLSNALRVQYDLLERRRQRITAS